MLLDWQGENKEHSHGCDWLILVCLKRSKQGFGFDNSLYCCKPAGTVLKNLCRRKKSITVIKINVLSSSRSETKTHLPFSTFLHWINIVKSMNLSLSINIYPFLPQKRYNVLMFKIRHIFNIYFEYCNWKRTWLWWWLLKGTTVRSESPAVNNTKLWFATCEKLNLISMRCSLKSRTICLGRKTKAFSSGMHLNK